MSLTSNPLQYDAQLKQMGIKAPKKDAMLKAPKKAATARVGAAVNKKLQAKFNTMQSKLLKSLAPEVIAEVGESPDSKNLGTHRSDQDASAVQQQDGTLSADSKAAGTLESAGAEEQKTSLLNVAPLTSGGEDLLGGLSLVATVVAKKPADSGADTTPARRAKADKGSGKKGS